MRIDLVALLDYFDFIRNVKFEAPKTKVEVSFVIQLYMYSTFHD